MILDKTGEVADISGSPQPNFASDFEQIRDCNAICNIKTVDLVASMTEWCMAPSMAEPLAYSADLEHVYRVSLVESE